MVHNVEIASLFWFTAPTSRDHVPNRVSQPLILTWVRWAGWPPTAFDIIVDHVVVSATIRQYTREDLVMSGGLYWGGGWFTLEERTEKEVIAKE